MQWAIAHSRLTPRGVLVLTTLAWCSATGVSLAEPPPPFPDDWFFGGAERAESLKVLEGKPAAALSIDEWIGGEVSVKESRGKVIVLDFWATWCGPCMAAIPHNIEMVSELGPQGLVFVGVHDSSSGWESAAAVVKDKGINYAVGRDKGGASVKDFAVQFWPTYVAIDRSGVIRAAGLLPGRVQNVVTALLAEAAGPEVKEPAAAEFAPEHYYGAANRPQPFKEMEGRVAPELKSAAWIGKEPGDAAMKGSVVVCTFVSPSLSASLGELDKLLPVEKELGSQGVVFVGVCDALGGDLAWAKMSEHAKAQSLTMPVMKDVAVDGAPARGDEPAVPAKVSATAEAFGIEHYPATVIIDRAGKVRAAGVRADKVKAIVEKLLAEQAGVGRAGAAEILDVRGNTK